MTEVISILFFKTMRSYVHMALWFFFRKWQVKGEHNIPTDTAVVYVVNHQNAFQDALLVACSTNDEPWFLTRGGVFKNKFARAIFHSFHMLPVYRFRDGVKGLRNNDATFRQCVNLLKVRKSILVFGEGDQSMRYQLRSLQKGFARIALTVQQESDWKIPLAIVPVGIQYDHFYDFRSRVLVNYGEAIPVDSELQPLPEREFYDALLEKTRRGLVSLMVHIEDEHYDAVETHLKQNRNKKDLAQQLEHDQRIVADWKTNPLGSERKPKNYFLLVLFFPLHLYVWVNNFIPYFLIRLILKKYVVLEFFGSVKLGLGMALVPLFYILQSIAVQFIFQDWKVTLGYLITLPFLSIWSIDLFKSAKGD